MSTWIPKPAPRPGRAPKKVAPRLKKSRLKSRGARTKKSGGHLFWKRRNLAYQAFVRTLRCWFCRREGAIQTHPTECEHLKTRGASGDDFDNLLPTCGRHRVERDTDGPKTFFARYADRGGVWEAAKKLTELYRLATVGGGLHEQGDHTDER